MKAPAIRSNTTDDYILRKAGSFTPDPLNDSEGLSMDAFIEAHQTERPLLINPYLDDPRDYFAWEVDTILEEVALTALPNSDLSAQAVRAAEEAYGLNRDELKKLRYETYLEYSTHRLCVSEPDVPDRVRNRSQARIDRMLQTRQPYVGMLLFFEKMPVSDLP